MKIMMFVKATRDSEAGKMPEEAMVAPMMKFNEELAKAGVLRDLGGLKPSSAGARLRFEGDTRTVIDGPFAETKELIAGFWIIEVASLAEGLEWAKRAPNPYGNATGEVELRPLFGMEDFEVSADTAARAERVEAAIAPKS